jgi:predicted kinase
MKTFIRWLEEDANKVLYIMRAVSGAGKSTTARSLVNNDITKIFSNDDFFYLDPMPGPYDLRHPETYNYEVYRKKWKPQWLEVAQQWNIRRVEDAMNKGISPIVVDNTNLRQRNARPYAALAQKYNYDIQIKEPESAWWNEMLPLLKNKKTNADEIANKADKFSRNLHGVPKEVIVNMLHNYQPYTVQDLLKAGAAKPPQL